MDQAGSDRVQVRTGGLSGIVRVGHNGRSMASDLTVGEFVQRWAGRELSERAAAQGHFIDVCRMLGVPAPTDNPVTDSEYGFEASRTGIRVWAG